MDTVKFNKQGVQMVAHRGLSGLETENTNAAFVAAGNRSYYGVETDIRKTADGRFVISHDADLKRIAGEDVRPDGVSLSTLQSIVLFDKDGSRDRADLRICTLENYVSICKKYEKHCVIELKAEFSDEDTAEFIKIISDMEYLDHVTFISFIYEDLLKVRRILPEQSVQFLFMDLTDELMERLIADRFDVDVFYKRLTREQVDRYHAAGMKVNCWTVNTAEDGERLAEWGVDFITTNILE